MSPGQQGLADGLVQGTLLSEGFINASKELQKLAVSLQKTNRQRNY